MAKKKGKEVTKQEAQLPAEMLEQMEGEAGAGHEDTTSDDYAIPFVGLLQKMSPAVDPDDGGYIEGAKAGMYCNSVTGELFERIRVVPCARLREYCEWISRDEGGGLAGRHAVDSAVVLNATRDGVRLIHATSGNDLMDTRYHYCLQLKDDGTSEPMVISMASTQIKKSKNWMTRMRQWLVDGSKGKFNPPMHGQIWTFENEREENEHGAWYGFKLAGDPELVSDPELYAAAKNFGEMAKEGVKLAEEPGTTTSSEPSSQGDGDDDEIPF